MGTKDQTNSGKLRVRDVVVILLCISGAVYSLYLFWLDLNQTLNSQTEQVGTITIKNNIVQRRIAKRVIWDRLFNESPVYLGDMIRVAELSSATLNIDENKIGIDENTLILIQRSASGDGRVQINLASGSLNFEAAPEENDTTIVLNIMGHEVTVNPGTTLNATAAENGMELKIIEGNAQVKSDGQERELSSGSMIALDAEGAERAVPAVVVLNPQPNAHYLTSGSSPQGVIFSWNRINLQPEDSLSLEIAEDRNFDRIIQRTDNLNTRAIESFAPGLSYWRLSLGSTVLSSGQVTVTNAAIPILISPVRNQEIPTESDAPTLQFQWSEVNEVSYYILQAGTTRDFSEPRISRQVGANSFTGADLGPGTWYWRVLPVFPSVYEGSAPYSSPAVFHITQANKPEASVAAVTPMAESDEVNLSLDESEPGLQMAEAQPEDTRPPLLAPPLSATPTPAQQRRQQEASRPTPAPAVPAPTPAPRPAPAAPAPTRPAAPAPEPLAPLVRPEPVPELQPRPEIVPEPQPVAVPPKLLPVAGNQQPIDGFRIGPTELRSQRNIVFRWSAVPGANAYIFTLYQEGANGRREIVQSEPENRTTWVLDSMQLLDRGTFIWQVEAVNMEQNGTIVQRGITAENTLIMDIPLPGEVMLEQPGVLYGN